MSKGKKLKVVLVLFILFGIVGFFAGVEVLHYSSEPKFCAICHPKQKPGPNGEVFTWKQSVHSKEEVECLDCHAKPGVINYFIRKVTAAKDLYTQLTHSTKEIEKKLAHPSAHAAPESSCLFCHTDEFNQDYRKSHFMSLPTEFLKFRQLDSVVNPDFREKKSLQDIMKVDEVKGYAFSHKEHMENYKELTCQSCHFESTGHPDFRKNYKLMMKNVCFECHEKNDGPENNECSTCHIVQDNVRKGKIENVTGDEDVMASLECSECHQSFKNLPEKKSCIECHDGDEEYGQTFKEWKQKTESKLEKIELLYLKSKEKALKDNLLSDKFKETEKLYQSLKNDNSKGIHNFEFTSQILEKIEKNFKEILNK